MTDKKTKPTTKELSNTDLDKVSGGGDPGEQTYIKIELQRANSTQPGGIVAAGFDNKAQRSTK